MQLSIHCLTITLVFNENKSIWTHPEQNKIENDQIFPKSIRASTICSSLVIQAGDLSIFDFATTNTNQTKLETETTIQPLGNLEFKIKVEHVTKCNKMV